MLRMEHEDATHRRADQQNHIKYDLDHARACVAEQTLQTEPAEFRESAEPVSAQGDLKINLRVRIVIAPREGSVIEAEHSFDILRVPSRGT